MPSVYNADVVVFATQMSADASVSAANWLEMPVKGAHPYYTRILPKSRIISATERWDCRISTCLAALKRGELCRMPFGEGL